ncbi:MAG: glutamate-5-semialdehyde dehydrogenase [Alphaproteobacteria bacterium]|nr:glutamate-5-semialdehyde dehydrogenase [Alphaproteobacteria bacterium]PPR12748.1 MAG: Gamma-glutamyl phosphate reductase [Alphaproteobacteria bacterium MarineAlpha12_Bin1]|tara:strand:+ start:2705 stop:3991 length:1287 start_codon:yes stop_codon:yes gene_type:complete
MNLKNETGEDLEIEGMIYEMGLAARKAGRILASAGSKDKNQAIKEASKNILEQKSSILVANKRDIETATEKGLSGALIDRLFLDDKRIEAMAKGLVEVAELPDPVGTKLSEWDRPNGLKISRVRVPLGVIGIIYESRPNVTADAGGLCLKSGNSAILRGGSDTFNTSSLILNCLKEGLVTVGLPPEALQAPQTTDRAAVGAMLAMSEFIDVIVPRGGKSLVERVQREARMPVFAHLEGICHTYIHENSQSDMARSIVVNAKMRRTGICGATETVLIDRNAANNMLKELTSDLINSGCEVRGDLVAKSLDDRISLASDTDWTTEYLDSIISIKVVDGVEEAINHINDYGSNHTDAIITDDRDVADHFLNQVDSGIVMHNTSTQFADGGEFGMGAEIGISTGRLHARGPVGAEQLTTYKYVVSGDGQLRP